MILKNFYQVTTKEILTDQESYEFEIKVNKDHPVFEGHFPNNSVMPGVCMMQIIKELTEGIVDEKLFMEKCSNVKFLALINPEVNPVLKLKLDIVKNDGNIVVKNVTKFEDTTALKLTSTYRKNTDFK